MKMNDIQEILKPHAYPAEQHEGCEEVIRLSRVVEVLHEHGVSQAYESLQEVVQRMENYADAMSDDDWAYMAGLSSSLKSRTL